MQDRKALQASYKQGDAHSSVLLLSGAQAVTAVGHGPCRWMLLWGPLSRVIHAERPPRLRHAARLNAAPPTHPSPARWDRCAGGEAAPIHQEGKMICSGFAAGSLPVLEVGAD